jgi:hypothetical protein
MRWFDQVLAFLDDADPGSAPARMRAFEIVLAVICVTELWVHAFEVRQLGGPFLWSLPVLTTLCGVVACVPAWRQLGLLLLALTTGVAVWDEFPATGNHVYLACFLCALCAFLDPAQKEERRLLTLSLRWVTCVILFFAGIQKLVHGYYTTGLMPAFLLQEHRFDQIFALLLPASEAQRLRAYTGLDGSGPYLVSAPLWLLASNLVWSFEIGLALALFAAWSRRVAVFAGIAFVAVIESGAREIVFGLLFVNLLLVFLSSDANRRFVPLAVIICVVVIVFQFGWLPAVELH